MHCDHSDTVTDLRPRLQTALEKEQALSTVHTCPACCKRVHVELKQFRVPLLTIWHQDDSSVTRYIHDSPFWVRRWA